MSGKHGNIFANFAAKSSRSKQPQQQRVTYMHSSDSEESNHVMLSRNACTSKKRHPQRLVSANAKFANRSKILHVRESDDDDSLEVVQVKKEEKAEKSMFGMHEMQSTELQRHKPASVILQKRKQMAKVSVPRLKKASLVTSSSSSSSSSWLSANKTLSQIERDAAAARASRRTNISKTKPKTRHTVLSNKNNRKKQKRKTYDSSSEDDVLSDGFVVNDDEDDELDEQSFQSEDESEPELSDSMLDEESSSSEEEEKEILSRKKKQKSNPTSSITTSRFFNEKKSFLQKSKSSTSRIQKKVVVELSSDEEDDFFTERTTKKSAAKEKKLDYIDLLMSDKEADEDLHVSLEERQAIKQALKLSMKDNIPPAKKNLKPAKREKNGKSITLLSDDETESDNEIQNDEEIDCFEEEDEESKVAGSVLRVTNHLSSFIVAQMTKWCVETSENELVDKKGVIQGMLVSNGALSAGSVATSSYQPGSNGGSVADKFKQGLSFSATPRWIEREEIEKLCPDLSLADYQLVGVNWLALLYTLTYKVEETGRVSHVNGVLADEMGLGKTVQTIAFLAWLRSQQMKGFHKQNIVGNQKKQSDRRRHILDEDEDKDDGDICDLTKDMNDSDVEVVEKRPHLIIVPASVLSNWMNEFEKFCPDMTVVKYHGSQAERDEIQDRLQKSLSKSCSKAPLDVVLTTFSYFSSERSDDRSFLRKFKFDYMVVDEAHCLKNPKSSRYRNMVKFNTTHRLLLTGTPVQNSPEELMALLCFLMPLFKRAHTSDEEDDGGRKMLDHFVTLSEEKTSSSSERDAYTKLKQLLAPFVLRRRKVHVLSQMLPPKTRVVERLPFDKATRKVYDGLLSNHLERKKAESVSKVDFLSDNSVNQSLFVNLRRAANHPLLLRTRYKTNEEKDHLAYHFHLNGYFGRDETCTIELVRKELDKFCDYDIHCAALDMIDENPCRKKDLDRYCLDADDLYTSPKLVRLRSLLPDLIKNGHRALIFSQWTKCLDILGSFLESFQLSFLRLDGATQITERQLLIDKFNNDSTIPIFLLSTRAGGMGINLTSADTCILHDLDFNPFNDLQAEDRCHRIGQKKEVTIIKMIVEDTVDADIYAIQERKAQMNAAIFESEGTTSKSKASEKKEEKEAINSILQTAMDRFMKSPKAKK